MYKKNKVCIYMIIAVMALQIIIPALSIVLKSKWSVISNASDDIIATWNIGASGSNVTANFYANGHLKIFGNGIIMDNVKWTKDYYNFETQIKKVTIEKGVTHIGKMVFFHLPCLKTVNAEYVTSIGESAFYDCSKLEIVNINKVKNVARNAFRGCKKLIIKIPHKIENIGDFAFYDVKQVNGDVKNCGNSLVLGNKLKSIGEKPFYNVKNIGEVLIASNGDEFKGTYYYIKEMFPKNTSLYVRKDVVYTLYELGISSRYNIYKMENIEILPPDPKTDYEYNEQLILNNIKLKVTFNNSNELVSNFDDGIFTCNFTNGDRLTTIGSKTVKIQFGKKLNENPATPFARYKINVRPKIKEIQIVKRSRKRCI